MKQFENIFLLLLLAVLAASLFIFRTNSDIVYLILGAIIGAFSKDAIKLENKNGEKKNDNFTE